MQYGGDNGRCGVFHVLFIIRRYHSFPGRYILRTVEADVRRNTKRKYADAIKYEHITYACIHGGRQFHSASKGLRPQQRYDILLAFILYTNVLPTICMDTLCVVRGMHIVYTPMAMYNKGQCVTPDVLI